MTRLVRISVRHKRAQAASKVISVANPPPKPHLLELPESAAGIIGVVPPFEVVAFAVTVTESPVVLMALTL